MKHNKLKIIIFLYLYAFTQWSCGPLFNSCVQAWRFEFPVQVENKQREYRVGDTIWVSSEFEQLRDIHSGEFKTFPPDYAFYTHMIVTQMDIKPTRFAYEDLTSIIQIGTFNFRGFSVSGEWGGIPGGYDINYLFENGKYRFKFGLIFHKSGVFRFIFGSPVWYKFEPVDFTPDCKDNIDSDFFTKLNSGNDNGYELYISTSEERFHGESEESYNLYGGFTFKVIE